MMSCWIVAGYMAYSGIDDTYNTIFYTEWMNLTSKGGEEIWTFRALGLHLTLVLLTDGDIHFCLLWRSGNGDIQFAYLGELGELFSVDMRSIGYASAWSEMYRRFCRDAGISWVVGFGKSFEFSRVTFACQVNFCDGGERLVREPMICACIHNLFHLVVHCSTQ